jgi:hypothetical protein
MTQIFGFLKKAGRANLFANSNKALGESQVHKVTDLLRSHPLLPLIINDPLKLEKVKAKQAVQEFLKV